MPDGAHTVRTAAAPWWRMLMVACTCVALGYLWIDRPTGYPIERDAYENLTAAYNLAHHGVMSIEDEPGAARTPSEHREPLPIIALAGYITALHPVLGDIPLAQMTTGPPARVLKYSNIPWAILLAVLIYGTVLRYVGSHGWAAAATLAVHWQLGYQYDFLYSEIAAAALLALASFVAARAYAQRRLGLVFVAGLCFGALTLTKAAFFYVSLVLLAALAVWGVWRRLRSRDRFGLRAAPLLALGLALAVGPWMWRNYTHFDTVKLSGRGGIVLLTRALKNNMTPEEYRGAWFAYAPRPLRQLTGVVTGFDKKDLEADGRLVRLMRFVSERDRPAMAAGTPDEAVSYYARANAMGGELARLYPETSDVAIDAMLKRRALALIQADPRAHLAATPLFLWRGAPYTFLILLVGTLYALAQRRWGLLVYLAPAMGMVMFYTVLTHFIPRYAEPMLPISAVVFAVLGHAAWCALRERMPLRGVRRDALLRAGALREAGVTEASR